MVTSKSRELLNHAIERATALAMTDIEEFIVCVINDIVDQLEQNPKLLRFINKNLSWGILRRSLTGNDMNDYITEFYQKASEGTPSYDNPQLMLFTIIESVSSTCYSLILDHDPVSMDDYRPYMNRVLRSIIASFQHKE